MNAWDAIVGHEWAVHVLQTALRQRRVGHAYLFTGPAQVGKTTLARTLAQALLCTETHPAGRPCGVCRACRLTAAGRHPDLLLIEPEISGRGKATLKIETIRQLQQGLQLAPYEGAYKIAILSQFDAANPNAANAFLKTLEEPPPSVILLLTALAADNVLETIRSRCRVLALRPTPASVIADALQHRGLASVEQARLLAHLAHGRFGWASSAAQDRSLLATRTFQLDQLRQALDSGRRPRFQLATQLASQPENLPPLLETWISWWRDVLLAAHGDPAEAFTNLDRVEEVHDLAQRWPADAIGAALRATQTALWQLDHNVNTQLVLEGLLLQFPYLQPAGRPAAP